MLNIILMIMKHNILRNHGFRACALMKSLRILMVFGAIAMFSTVSGNDATQGDNSFPVHVLVRDANTGESVLTARIEAVNNRAAATLQDDESYIISLTSPNEILRIVAIGYGTREVPLRGRERLVVDLFPDIFTDNYREIESFKGPVRKSFMPLAYGETRDVDHPSILTIDDVIKTRLGGNVRSVNRSGVAGMGSSMFIRGFNSLNMNAQPLIIVDGVIWNSLYDINSIHAGYFGNTLADLDLNDVESISVIKDGTSIYGSKGANGVILIKTRRGEGVVTQIEFNAYGGITTQPESLPVMGGDQFRIYASELLGTTNIHRSEYSQYGFLMTDPTRPGYNRFHNNTNWDNEVYRTGLTHSYHVSVNGGDNMALYALSVGYTGVEGVVRDTRMERLTTRFNADFDLSELFTLGLNVSFSNVDRELFDDGVVFHTSPTYLAMIKSPFLNPYTFTSAGVQSNDHEDSDEFGISNPSAVMDRSLNVNKHYRFSLGAKPTFYISPRLQLSTHFDYSLDKVKETYFRPILGVADIDLPGYGVSENMFMSQQMRNVAIFDDTRLTYRNTFDHVHRIDAMAGWRFLSNYYELDYGEGHNSGTDQRRNLYGDMEFRFIDGINDRIRSIANYANVEYSFDNRYFVTAAVSMDASSRFGKETEGGFQMLGHSWGMFPSLNAAWLVSSEEFMAGADFIDRLKFRAGYGISGNDDIAAFSRDSYLISTPYMNRANGLIIGNIANTSIQWETTSKATFGFDAILLNDRVALSAGIFHHNTKDLLGLKELPEVAGQGYYWQNGGELQNQGFDFSANVKVINNSNFQWELGASIGHYRNEIVSLPDGDYTTTIYGAEILTSVGNPAGLFYGYKTNGVFATEAEALAAGLLMTNSQGHTYLFGAGDVHFEDVDGDGFITANDKQIIGDPNPDFYGSFNTRFGYKNFTLDAFFTYSVGNDVYNHLRASLESGSDFSNQSTAMLTRWRAEGQQTNQPRAYYGDPMGNSRFSDRWIEDGSFLKLKSIKLNYKVPVQSNWLGGLDVWVAANNLWTMTDYLGRDPEVSVGNGVLYQGIDAGLLPSTKSFFVGVKMNL
ncbi:TonB-linked SusC/RagA family outer membrane protein [Natronoflexus pectinivorans]|uniref:TonB-linked SusC/RagA family outer membrane protein n=2 Tax=Natronoflexus pectinivorans TaxID=682526 RepID=A0A4R2GM76_9BACT|nr:TonB-linked SusC/RagA family outer membrane protein [Natronoflexus pectinivorans]